MRRGLIGPVLLVGVGCVLLAHNFLPGFRLGPWWPFVLLAAGVALLLDRRAGRNH